MASPGPESRKDLVSVIIPAYNAAKTLEQTLRSALGQQDVELEILVVDDGSSDGTSELVQGFDPRVRLLPQANAGVGAARNHGLREARGGWVAFLDSDDLWEPTKLHSQLNLLSMGWPYGVCYTGLRLIDEHGEELQQTIPWAEPGPRPQGWIFRSLLFEGNPICTSSVLVSNALMDRVGPFVCDPGESEDYDLWLRLARQAAFLFHPAPLTRYRVLEASYFRGDARRARLRTLRTLARAIHRWDLDRPRDRARLRARRAGIYCSIAHELKLRGDAGEAARWLLRALREAPLASPAAAQIAGLLLPGALKRRVGILRRAWGG